MTEQGSSHRPPAPRRTRPKDSGGWDTKTGAQELIRLTFCLALLPLVIGAILCVEGMFVAGVIVWILSVAALCWAVVKRSQRDKIRARAEASRIERLRNRMP